MAVAGGVRGVDAAHRLVVADSWGCVLSLVVCLMLVVGRLAGALGILRLVLALGGRVVVGLGL